jgi:hypothetical protein
MGAGLIGQSAASDPGGPFPCALELHHFETVATLVIVVGRPRLFRHAGESLPSSPSPSCPMPETVKCPACADQTQQQLMGHVSIDNQPAKRPPPALYRCGACKFLYTVPKLADHKPAEKRG